MGSRRGWTLWKYRKRQWRGFCQEEEGISAAATDFPPFVSVMMRRFPGYSFIQFVESFVHDWAHQLKQLAVISLQNFIDLTVAVLFWRPHSSISLSGIDYGHHQAIPGPWILISSRYGRRFLATSCISLQLSNVPGEVFLIVDWWYSSVLWLPQLVRGWNAHFPVNGYICQVDFICEYWIGRDQSVIQVRWVCCPGAAVSMYGAFAKCSGGMVYPLGDRVLNA